MKRKNFGLVKIKQRQNKKNQMTSNKIKILFISRTYPPVVGGMERVSFNLIKSIARLDETVVTAIVNRGGKQTLPIFLIALLPKILISARKYDLVHLSDAVLAPFGDIIKMIHPKVKVVCTVHGLDITYAGKNSFYKKINLPALFSLDRIIAVSQATKQTALDFKVPKRLVTVIPNGVGSKEIYNPKIKKQALATLLKKKSKQKFDNQLAGKLKEKVFILTLGRLRKRKGVAWFIENVLGKLNSNVVYLVAGDGEEKENIQKIAKKLHLEDRVYLLGFVSSEEKQVLLNTVDIFVQPSIKIKNDMEGFGVSMLEASSCKLPVVATGIEGIKEAVTSGENGFLIKLDNVSAWIKVLRKLIEDPELRHGFGEKAREYTIRNFEWNIIAKRYLKTFKQVMSEKRK
ncbi:MAG: glycosyltransferase family 4 protein [Patescibacteria group bacterium]|nr:glycosyltransferase family 4 protein [Patescibacteria group bacterium]